MGSVDLSKTTRLKEVSLSSDLHPQWITATLRTLTPNHQNVLLCVELPLTFDDLDPDPIDALEFRGIIGEAAYFGWLELDYFLVRLWESKFGCTEIIYYLAAISVKDTRSCMESLFPKSLKSGAAKLLPLKGPEWESEDHSEFDDVT